MNIRSLLVGLTALTALQMIVVAQDPTPTQAASDSDASVAIFAPTIQLIKDNPDNAGSVAIRNLIPFVQIAATDDVNHRFKANLLSQLEQSRVDQQSGPGSNQNGSTNAVTKGSVPWLLGLAVEYGGMTQSTSGTTTTFKLNPINLIAALSNDKSYLDSYVAGNSTFMVKYLRLVTFGFSFDTGSQSSGVESTTTTTPTNSNAFTGFTAHCDIHNKRDPRDPKWKDKWEPVFREYGKPAAFELSEVQRTLLSGAAKDAYDAWLIKTREAVEKVKKSTDVEILKVLQTQADSLRQIIASDKSAQAAVDRAADGLLTYSAARNSLIDDIMKSTIISAEYNLVKQSNQPLVNTGSNMTVATSGPIPDLSNFNLIIETPFFKVRSGDCANPKDATTKCSTNWAQFTANLSTTLFNSIPPGSGAGRVRDYQLAGQLDIPSGIVPKSVGSITTTVSGLFLSLLQQPLGQPVQVNGVDINTKGNIGLFQAKLSVKLKSGVEFPISFTYATRTQLIKESDVRGNIGITFNLDNLFAGSEAGK